jgi:hypothetical protein
MKTTLFRVVFCFDKGLKGLIYMGLRYVNGIPEKMQIHFAKKGTAIVEDGAPQEPTIPFGTYLLIKQ